MTLLDNDTRQHIRLGDIFAAVAMPGEGRLHLLRGEETLTVNKWGETSAFNNVITSHPPVSRPSAPMAVSSSTSRGEYLNSVGRVVEQLKRQGGKTVISRVIDGDASNLDVSALAEEYFSRFPATMRCVFSHPLTGMWIVASPELLLSLDKATGVLSTCALAGTRPTTMHSQPWDDKNLREHATVADYVYNTLLLMSLSPVRQATKTIRWDTVEHLHTPIDGMLTADVTFYDILDHLSPTPALCGYPRHRAMAMIDATETHERKCYGGYLAYETARSITAYVCLRCMRVHQGRYTIYTGGGIMPDSDPMAEWDETTAKASYLTSLIETISNGRTSR